MHEGKAVAHFELSVQVFVPPKEFARIIRFEKPQLTGDQATASKVLGHLAALSFEKLLGTTNNA